MEKDNRLIRLLFFVVYLFSLNLYGRLLFYIVGYILSACCLQNGASLILLVFYPIYSVGVLIFSVVISVALHYSEYTLLKYKKLFWSFILLPIILFFLTSAHNFYKQYPKVAEVKETTKSAVEQKSYRECHKIEGRLQTIECNMKVAIENQDTKFCTNFNYDDHFKNPEKRNYQEVHECLEEIAIKKEDPFACLHTECVYNVAMLSENKNLCEGIEANFSSHLAFVSETACSKSVDAYISRDYSLCPKVSFANSPINFDCVVEIAKLTRDKQACEIFENQNVISLCKQELRF